MTTSLQKKTETEILRNLEQRKQALRDKYGDDFSVSSETLNANAQLEYETQQLLVQIQNYWLTEGMNKAVDLYHKINEEEYLKSKSEYDAKVTQLKKQIREGEQYIKPQQERLNSAFANY